MRITLDTTALESFLEEASQLSARATDPVEAWCRYESSHQALFDCYYKGWGKPGRRSLGAQSMQETAERVQARSSEWRQVIEETAAVLSDFLPDIEIPAVMFVGSGTSNGWATSLNGKITVFLAAELAPPPPLLSILVAHEATHAVQSTLDCAWAGDDYTIGALLFAEGLATYVSALAFPGLPWDHYLWFDSSHETWLRQCGDAWPAASAALADALETCGGDAEHRFFSDRADEGDAVLSEPWPGEP